MHQSYLSGAYTSSVQLLMMEKIGAKPKGIAQ
jgi:hypothetical protein